MATNTNKNKYLFFTALAMIVMIAYWSSSSLRNQDTRETSSRASSVVPSSFSGPKTVLLTGCGGFIGSNTGELLIKRGDNVICVDEMNDYYSVALKEENVRLQREASIQDGSGTFEFHKQDITDKEAMYNIFRTCEEQGRKITHIVHLAARAGVRPSIIDPYVYIHSNVLGTMVILDLAKDFKVHNLVFASTSSVYGSNEKIPFAESDRVDHPVSMYAATKRSTELMAYVYHDLYDIPMAALRFFTVYGPRGRPDMAPFKFIDQIYRGVPIHKFGDGSTSRDYTFIADIAQGVVAALDRTVQGYEIYNLGNSRRVSLNQFIELVEKILGKKAIIEQKGPQPGDVPLTYADIAKSKSMLGYDPMFPFEKGLNITAQWYINEYYPKFINK
eukprot:CAMPEP_0174251546 /NCGR_PEP_ID=MMETSP0439-20130205/1335_1 /TAXON_ID=0 /ORGANISM="Stereomyxa ramosa, Strain Chinc5" /LENGTH=387 /DNA_ID=CAMNT_0015331887 /DNA_START=42 /DNA_END=1205 /DNA_ORIENTATION=-